MPPTNGEDEEVATGDKEEDLPLEEMYPPQDMGVLPDASTVAKKDIMHTTVLKRSSYPTMKGNKPTLYTWKKRENRTTKCKMHKNWTQ